MDDRLNHGFIRLHIANLDEMTGTVVRILSQADVDLIATPGLGDKRHGQRPDSVPSVMLDIVAVHQEFDIPCIVDMPIDVKVRISDPPRKDRPAGVL